MSEGLRKTRQKQGQVPLYVLKYLSHIMFG